MILKIEYSSEVYFNLHELLTEGRIYCNRYFFRFLKQGVFLRRDSCSYLTEVNHHGMRTVEAEITACCHHWWWLRRHISGVFASTRNHLQSNSG